MLFIWLMKFHPIPSLVELLHLLVLEIVFQSWKELQLVVTYNSFFVLLDSISYYIKDICMYVYARY